MIKCARGYGSILRACGPVWRGSWQRVGVLPEGMISTRDLPCEKALARVQAGEERRASHQLIPSLAAFSSNLDISDPSHFCQRGFPKIHICACHLLETLDWKKTIKNYERYLPLGRETDRGNFFFFILCFSVFIFSTRTTSAFKMSTEVISLIFSLDTSLGDYSFLHTLLWLSAAIWRKSQLLSKCDLPSPLQFFFNPSWYSSISVRTYEMTEAWLKIIYALGFALFWLVSFSPWLFLCNWHGLGNTALPVPCLFSIWLSYWVGSAYFSHFIEKKTKTREARQLPQRFTVSKGAGTRQIASRACHPGHGSLAEDPLGQDPEDIFLQTLVGIS